MRKLLILFIFLLCAAPAFAQTADTITWSFDGLERTYILHAPETLVAPAPLVIALHGRFDSGAGMERLTHFDELADREGFIVAYPDGIEGEWNFVRDVPGYEMKQDDTAFLSALVDHITEDHAVDRTRVYLVGFSNGGFMTQRAACENPAPFAAFASVAAAGFGGMTDVCPETGSLPAPMLLINGTADTNIPWDGTPITRSGRTIYLTYPVSQTLGYWANYNACPADGDMTDVPPKGHSPDTQVRILTLKCPSDTAVLLYGIVGGGHNWPGQAESGIAEITGAINRDIDASEEIWKFFAQHTRTPQAEATPEVTASTS